MIVHLFGILGVVLIAGSIGFMFGFSRRCDIDKTVRF